MWKMDIEKEKCCTAMKNYQRKSGMTVPKVDSYKYCGKVNER